MSGIQMRPEEYLATEKGGKEGICFWHDMHIKKGCKKLSGTDRTFLPFVKLDQKNIHVDSRLSDHVKKTLWKSVRTSTSIFPYPWENLENSLENPHLN